MRRERKEKWQRDISLRQHNLVFPDTASNEARFWRNMLSNREKLGATQVIGIIFVCMTLLGSLYCLISIQFRVSDVRAPISERIIGSFGSWIILLVIAVAALVVGQLISQRSRSKAPKKSLSFRRKR